MLWFGFVGSFCEICLCIELFVDGCDCGKNWFWGRFRWFVYEEEILLVNGVGMWIFWGGKFDGGKCELFVMLDFIDKLGYIVKGGC